MRDEKRNFWKLLKFDFTQNDSGSVKINELAANAGKVLTTLSFSSLNVNFGRIVFKNK